MPAGQHTCHRFRPLSARQKALEPWVLCAPPLEGFHIHGLPLMLSTLKKAEDSDTLILRMFETYGARGAVRLEIPDLKAL